MCMFYFFGMCPSFTRPLNPLLFGSNIFISFLGKSVLLYIYILIYIYIDIPGPEETTATVCIGA